MLKGHIMLTATQKTLVQESFATIAPIADDAAALFYRRLFELDPSLKALFRGDMTEQRKKLMQMLTAAVKGLDRLDQFVPVVQRDALVAAIGAQSPERTDSLEAAWREAVTAIIVPMLQGAAVHTAMVAEQIAIDMPSP